MARIINAKFADGDLYELEIAAGNFKSVTKQKSPIPRPQGTIRLENFSDANKAGEVFDATGLYVFPALIDAHIHSRDPGLSHKEDWRTLAASSFKGGVGAVFDMPNTLPATLDEESIEYKANIAAKSGLGFQFYVGVIPSNVGKLAAFLTKPGLPVCGLKIYYGHSTGGLVFNDLELLEKSLPKKFEKVIAFHSEDQCVIDENTAKLHPHVAASDYKGFSVHSQIRSSQSAMTSTKAILAWAEKYRRPIHIAHLSTPQELELIAAARGKGAQVTSEVAPHHLLFCDEDYEKLGPYLKMNPPVRTRAEMLKLREYFGQGLIEVFATDHAPHTRKEKETSYDQCPSGVPAIEFFTPLLLKTAQLAKLPLASAVKMASEAPARIFDYRNCGTLAPGFKASFTCVKVEEVTIDEREVTAKCGWSPYTGLTMPAEVLATWLSGKRVYTKRSYVR